MSKSRMLKFLLLACAIVAAFAIAACGSSDSSDSTAADSTSATSLADCTPDTLDTVKSGTLTIGTDKPAYPPYFEDNDPTNGKGFESAVAYAIADQLGFSQDEVEWTVVPFNSSYAPGPKDFDFDINQISITPKRAKQVDFSSPYYTADQAVVALKDSDAADATSLADLKGAKIGVQIGTTSLDAVNEVIQPDNDPQVFNNSNDVVTRAQAAPGRRGRRRPADRALPDRRPGAGRRRSSASSPPPAATSGGRCWRRTRR